MLSFGGSSKKSKRKNLWNVDRWVHQVLLKVLFYFRELLLQTPDEDGYGSIEAENIVFRILFDMKKLFLGYAATLTCISALEV